MTCLIIALVLVSNVLALRIGASFGRSLPRGTLGGAARELLALCRKWIR